MGALRKLMPITAATFIVGWLAIAGVPPFAGFWSKDEILLYTLAKSPALYVIGLVTALLTAFYMTRQVIMVFFGKARWESHAEEHGAHGEFKPHESPPIMLFPLVVLAVLSTVGGVHPAAGFSWIPDDWQGKLERWLEPVVEIGEANITDTTAYDNKGWLALVAIAVAFAGIVAAYAIYAQRGASRSSRRSWKRAGSTTGRSAPSWGAGPQGVRRHRLVRQHDHRRRRQGRRALSSRPPVSSAGVRPATCATTPRSSASASCCCWPGS